MTGRVDGAAIEAQAQVARFEARGQTTLGLRVETPLSVVVADGGQGALIDLDVSGSRLRPAREAPALSASASPRASDSARVGPGSASRASVYGPDEDLLDELVRAMVGPPPGLHRDRRLPARRLVEPRRRALRHRRATRRPGRSWSPRAPRPAAAGDPTWATSPSARMARPEVSCSSRTTFGRTSRMTARCSSAVISPAASRRSAVAERDPVHRPAARGDSRRRGRRTSELLPDMGTGREIPRALCRTPSMAGGVPAGFAARRSGT